MPPRPGSRLKKREPQNGNGNRNVVENANDSNKPKHSVSGSRNATRNRSSATGAEHRSLPPCGSFIDFTEHRTHCQHQQDHRSRADCCSESNVPEVSVNGNAAGLAQYTGKNNNNNNSNSNACVEQRLGSICVGALVLAPQRHRQFHYAPALVTGVQACGSHVTVCFFHPSDPPNKKSLTGSLPQTYRVSDMVDSMHDTRGIEDEVIPLYYIVPIPSSECSPQHQHVSSSFSSCANGALDEQSSRVCSLVTRIQQLHHQQQHPHQQEYNSRNSSHVKGSFHLKGEETVPMSWCSCASDADGEDGEENLHLHKEDALQNASVPSTQRIFRSDDSDKLGERTNESECNGNDESRNCFFAASRERRVVFNVDSNASSQTLVLQPSLECLNGTPPCNEVNEEKEKCEQQASSSSTTSVGTRLLLSQQKYLCAVSSDGYFSSVHAPLYRHIDYDIHCATFFKALLSDVSSSFDFLSSMKSMCRRESSRSCSPLQEKRFSKAPVSASASSSSTNAVVVAVMVFDSYEMLRRWLCVARAHGHTVILLDGTSTPESVYSELLLPQRSGVGGGENLAAANSFETEWEKIWFHNIVSSGRYGEWTRSSSACRSTRFTKKQNAVFAALLADDVDGGGGGGMEHASRFNSSTSNKRNEREHFRETTRSILRPFLVYSASTYNRGVNSSSSSSSSSAQAPTRSRSSCSPLIDVSSIWCVSSGEAHQQTHRSGAAFQEAHSHRADLLSSFYTNNNGHSSCSVSLSDARLLRIAAEIQAVLRCVENSEGPSGSSVSSLTIPVSFATVEAPEDEDGLAISVVSPRSARPQNGFSALQSETMEGQKDTENGVADGLLENDSFSPVVLPLEYTVIVPTPSAAREIRTSRSASPMKGASPPSPHHLLDKPRAERHTVPSDVKPELLEDDFHAFQTRREDVNFPSHPFEKRENSSNSGGGGGICSSLPSAHCVLAALRIVIMDALDCFEQLSSRSSGFPRIAILVSGIFGTNSELPFPVGSSSHLLDTISSLVPPFIPVSTFSSSVNQVAAHTDPTAALWLRDGGLLIVDPDTEECVQSSLLSDTDFVICVGRSTSQWWRRVVAPALRADSSLRGTKRSSSVVSCSATCVVHLLCEGEIVALGQGESPSMTEESKHMVDGMHQRWNRIDPLVVPSPESVAVHTVLTAVRCAAERLMTEDKKKNTGSAATHSTSTIHKNSSSNNCGAQSPAFISQPFTGSTPTFSSSIVSVGRFVAAMFTNNNNNGNNNCPQTSVREDSDPNLHLLTRKPKKRSRKDAHSYSSDALVAPVTALYGAWFLMQREAYEFHAVAAQRRMNPDGGVGALPRLPRTSAMMMHIIASTVSIPTV